MKIDYVEMCGFRGFRDRVRLELASGFVVVTGSNGVGKSTICDAIEFAITGNIDKYRVEKAAQETLSDYLWWRGEGAAPGHYVTVGFSHDQGRKIEVTRSREDGANMTAHDIEFALCVAETKPDLASSQVCRTSIIRDELIAALSLDLTETERFELVSASLGAINGPDYSAKAAKVLEVAKTASDQAEKDYELAREWLNAAIADLAQARDAVANTGDMQAAMALLDQAVGDAHSDVAWRLSEARSYLADRRQRLAAVLRDLDVARNAEAELRGFDTPETQAEVAHLHAEIDRLDQSRRDAATLYAAATEQLRTEQEQDKIAAALAALVEYGEAIGLHDGHCPLCAAPRLSSRLVSRLLGRGYVSTARQSRTRGQASTLRSVH